jgi:hypothetical protein
MAFIKLQIEFYLIDALRNGDAAYISQAILSALACPHDNVVYAGCGLAVTIAELTKLSPRSIRRELSGMQERGFLTKLDEYSCQINPEYMQKTSKRINYHGNKQVQPNSEESEFLIKIHTIAIQSWEQRGKNYKVVSTEDKDAMIKNLQKELRQERKAAANRHDELKSMLSEVVNLLKKHEPEEADKVERKLTLVRNDKATSF